jgi:hypothetical protein
VSTVEVSDNSFRTERRADRRAGWWYAGGLALFVFGFLDTVTRGVSVADESWFLQLIQRVTSGDILYRDVFFGATPLSVYVTASLTALFGTEVLVTKAIVALCFVFAVLLSCQVARQLSPTSHVPLLLIGALIGYAPAWSWGVYQPLAQVFFLACLTATLSWTQHGVKDAGTGDASGRKRAPLAIAGLMAGLCFATKQNIGLYGWAAILLTVALSPMGRAAKRERLACLFLVSGVFVTVSALALLPVWLSGGMEKLVDYGFINKRTYIQVAGIPYLGQLSQLALLAKSPSWANLGQIFWNMAFILPLATFATLPVAWLKSSPERKPIATAMFVFAGAAFLGAFPRVDLAHLSSAVPALLLGLAYAWYQVRPSLSRRVVYVIKAGLVVWVMVGLSATIAFRAIRITSKHYEVSTLSHFHGALFPREQYAAVSEYTRILAKEAAGERPFLLFPHAGFYYLTTDLKNPTPFDYPLVTAFGVGGQEDVIAAISGGRIRTVCMRSQGSSPLRAALLESYVEEHMERGREIGLCTIYSSRR